MTNNIFNFGKQILVALLVLGMSTISIQNAFAEPGDETIGASEPSHGGGNEAYIEGKEGYDPLSMKGVPTDANVEGSPTGIKRQGASAQTAETTKTEAATASETAPADVPEVETISDEALISDAPAGDPAALADLAVTDVLGSAAQTAEKEAELDEVFAEILPTPAEAEGGAPSESINPDALVQTRLAALTAAATEASLLASGAPVNGGGPGLGLDGGDINAGFEMFRGIIADRNTFEYMTQGLNVPPETLGKMQQTFEGFQNRFEQMASRFETMMGNPGTVGGTEGFRGPEGFEGPMPVFNTGDFAMLAQAAFHGVDSEQFMASMEKMMEARMDFIENFHNVEGGPFPGGDFQPGNMPFDPGMMAQMAAQFMPEGFNPGMIPGGEGFMMSGFAPEVLGGDSMHFDMAAFAPMLEQMGFNPAELGQQILQNQQDSGQLGNLPLLLPPEIIAWLGLLTVQSNFSLAEYNQLVQGGVPITESYVANIGGLPAELHVTYSPPQGGGNVQTSVDAHPLQFGQHIPGAEENHTVSLIQPTS